MNGWRLQIMQFKNRYRFIIISIVRITFIVFMLSWSSLCRSALADTHIHVRWTSVYNEISPRTGTHRSDRGTEFIMHGKVITYLADSGNIKGEIGSDTNIKANKSYATKISIRGGKVVKSNQFPGFRQFITISTDGMSRCDAIVQWEPNPGNQFLESTMTDGGKRLFQAHAEDIDCKISNETAP